MSPAPTASRSARWPGSKRLTKPNMTGTSLLDRMASAHFWTRLKSRSIGFSQRTGLPAATALSSKSAWVGVDVAINTASTSSFLITASTESKTGTLSLAPTSSAAGRCTSSTPASDARGCAAMLAACMRPILPQPSTAIFNKASSSAQIFAMLVAKLLHCQ